MPTRSREELLQLHATILRDLSRRGLWHRGDRREAFAQLCEVAATTLDVERVSIWLYDESRSSIVCAELYERSLDRHSAGAVLARADFPAYFEALEDERSIAAHDAARDPRTCEFADSYLAPLGITSMLDAPIQTGGRSVGVVCHEHVGPERTWSHEEESFAASLGDFAALTLEAEQRRLVEARLRESNLELRLALQAASMGIWSWDLASDLVQVSDETARLFGRGDNWQPDSLDAFVELAHPEDRAPLRETLRRAVATPRQPRDLQFRIALPSGDHRWVELRGQAEVDANGRTNRILGTVGDRTEQRELEAQLFHAQKMEGIGHLAGGIAHDFNNLLLVIMGFADLLDSHGDRREDRQESVRAIQDASSRAAGLTRQLLSFARRQPVQSEPVDVAALIAGMSELLQRLLGETIQLRIRSSTSATTRADATQLEQVVVNLCVNARDALPDGGHITISVDEVDHVPGAADGCGPDEAGAPGRHLHLTVVDDGVGIAEDVLPNVFDPFFTTKGIGKGTGLGLATCYGIVHQSDGDIRIDSEVSVGTTVHVYLPISTSARLPERAGRAGAATARGGETVLVVEDEDLVLRLMESVLGGAGYEVLTARSAADALQVLAARERDVQMLVSDVVLPDRTGIDLAEQIRRRRPGLPALFVSGYAHQHLRTRDEFLPKPFLPAQLLRAVRSVLDRAPGEAT
ncbi:MAG: ATP-binding protein [Planctomycetota bacterium]